MSDPKYVRLDLRIKPKRTNSSKFSLVFMRTEKEGKPTMLTRKEISANSLMSLLLAGGMKAKDSRELMMNLGIPKEFFEWPNIFEKGVLR